MFAKANVAADNPTSSFAIISNQEVVSSPTLCNSPINILYPRENDKKVNIGGRLIDWGEMLVFFKIGFGACSFKNQPYS